jgi:hypothetical protein
LLPLKLVSPCFSTKKKGIFFIMMMASPFSVSTLPLRVASCAPRSVSKSSAFAPRQTSDETPTNSTVALDVENAPSKEKTSTQTSVSVYDKTEDVTEPPLKKTTPFYKTKLFGLGVVGSASTIIGGLLKEWPWLAAGIGATTAIVGTAFATGGFKRKDKGNTVSVSTPSVETTATTA